MLQKWRLIFASVVLLGLALVALIPDIGTANRAKESMQCTNSLKQVAVALSNYIDTFGHLPHCSIVDAKGDSVHSWRAIITPSMAALPQVYRWDEPWNGALNARLLDGTPIHLDGPNDGTRVKGLPWHGPIDYAFSFRCPRGRQLDERYRAEYYAITGSECVWKVGHECTLLDIADGPENTILVAESITIGAYWSEPVDLDFRQMSFTINDVTQSSISSSHGSPGVVFADGQVYRLDPTTPENIVRALLTSNGGENIKRAELIRDGWLR